MPKILAKKIPQVMGILNVTPDSFSDGGRFNKLDKAIQQAEKMIKDGVDIIDIGGESTRPGAESVSLREELQRVIPVIEKVATLGIPISVDTSKAEVMKQAMASGASMINDVRALTELEALQVVAETKAEVCLMHMQGQPQNMQQSPSYNNLVQEIAAFLKVRVEACVTAGIKKESICIDPGFGFGKTLEDNCNLMRTLHELQELDLPLLIGVSRKKMIGDILEVEADERLIGSISAGVIALTKGAKILRVHDVKETAQAVKIYKALNS